MVKLRILEFLIVKILIYIEKLGKLPLGKTFLTISQSRGLKLLIIICIISENGDVGTYASITPAVHVAEITIVNRPIIRTLFYMYLYFIVINKKCTINYYRRMRIILYY